MPLDYNVASEQHRGSLLSNERGGNQKGRSLTRKNKGKGKNIGGGRHYSDEDMVANYHAFQRQKLKSQHHQSEIMST